eukprot:gb/GFBE01072853.1/.p1 GENE.gb/GFBE01072853.1/~~gb/GFBE01072853.1/.p1  ORF type:complete len:593 (+),score=113.77 gb/GFBE01072853.1/:1-1779(+)
MNMGGPPPPPPTGMPPVVPNAKFAPAPNLTAPQLGGGPMGGCGQPWQGGMQQQPMQNGMAMGKGGIRPNWGGGMQQGGQQYGQQSGGQYGQQSYPQQQYGMNQGLQRQNSLGSQIGGTPQSVFGGPQGPGLGGGCGMGGPLGGGMAGNGNIGLVGQRQAAGPQVVPPPPGPLGGTSPAGGMQYGQYGQSGKASGKGQPRPTAPSQPAPPPPPHPNWQPGQPPPPPGPGPPGGAGMKPGGTLEAAMRAAAALGADGRPAMMEATSAIDFTAKLEDLRRKHPQVKVPPEAWTWKAEELDAWFASGGTSKTPPSAAPKPPPPEPTSKRDSITPKKRTSSEANGWEFSEALQLQRQLIDHFQAAEFQDTLKQLQAQYPERKTKGHLDCLAFFEAFNALALSVHAKVLPNWGLSPDWDGVREMNNKMADALTHPKVKKTQEEMNVLMGLPRNVQFVPPSKGSELFLYRPDSDGPVPGYSRPLMQDEDGDEAHEFLVEDPETGELKAVGPTSLEQEMWFLVLHKPAVVIRELPDEKAKMVGRKKAGKRLRVQKVKDGKWLQLHHSELVKLGVQEAWVLMDPVEAGLPADQPLLEKVSS